MKVAQLFQHSKNTLLASKISSATLDSTILISHIFGLNKEQILLRQDLEIPEEKLLQFYELLNRRAKFEPISHLIGKREFFGEEFLVSSAVLDPRPDSETLIEAVLKKFPREKSEKNFERNSGETLGGNSVKNPEKNSVLEIGVGSGCLLISLL